MADRNNGLWLRFENGAKLLIGSNEIFNLVPGSLRRMVRQRERVPNRDRGALTGITVGDERAQQIEFELWRTKNLTTLLNEMLPAATAGAETFFTLTIKEPDNDGAATGQQWVYNKCYLPDGFDDQAAGAGQEGDKVTIKITHHGGPVTPTTY